MGTKKNFRKLAAVVHPDVHMRRASEIEGKAEREEFQRQLVHGMTVLPRCREIVQHEKDSQDLLFGKRTEPFALGEDVRYSTAGTESERILRRHERNERLREEHNEFRRETQDENIGKNSERETTTAEKRKQKREDAEMWARAEALRQKCRDTNEHRNAPVHSDSNEDPLRRKTKHAQVKNQKAPVVH